MIPFSDLTNFNEGYNFFMLRPSRAVNVSIIMLTVLLIVALTWAHFAKMDEIVEATALLRPTAAISTVKALAGGEVLKKDYIHDGYVHEGDLLLQLDVAADKLELSNSRKVMDSVETYIMLHKSLLETIKSDLNCADTTNIEAYTRSESYLIEQRRFLGEVASVKIKLDREQSLPDTLKIRQRIEDLSRELDQTKLQYALWKNNEIMEAMNELESSIQNKRNLERRISDLERNIRNATFFAPISGRINELRKLNVGDYLLPGEALIAIVPEDAKELKAELYVDPAYIAQVKVGQKAILRFPGLPPSKFGKLEAKISLIPADYAFGPDSVAQFIVEANIVDPWLTAPNGERIYLRPGIGAVVRIVVAQDTILMTILKKLDFINEYFERNDESIRK